MSDVPKKLTFGQLHQKHRGDILQKYRKQAGESELEVAITAKYVEIKQIYDRQSQENGRSEKVRKSRVRRRARRYFGSSCLMEVSAACLKTCEIFSN